MSNSEVIKSYIFLQWFDLHCHLVVSESFWNSKIKFLRLVFAEDSKGPTEEPDGHSVTLADGIPNGIYRSKT